MTVYGLKISKKDKDAKTASNLDLSVNSDVRMPRVSLASSRTVSVQANFTTTVTINHGMNTRPIFSVYGQKDPSDPMLFAFPVSIGSANITAICHSDLNNLYIGLSCGSATTTGTIKIYYFIFSD